MSRAMPLEQDEIQPGSGVGLGSARRTDSSVRVATEEAGELYEAWAARVRGYVRFRVRDESDAEDLVSEVFRRVVTKADAARSWSPASVDLQGHPQRRHRLLPTSPVPAPAGGFRST